VSQGSKNCLIRCHCGFQIRNVGDEFAAGNGFKTDFEQEEAEEAEGMQKLALSFSATSASSCSRFLFLKSLEVQQK
jgi:hypothetical protein